MKNKKNMKLIHTTCPNCSITFGIDRSFAYKVSELNFRYSCPYCSYKAKLV